MPLPIALAALAGGSIGASFLNSFTAPKFQAPKAHIDEAAIDRLINLSRTQGLATIQRQAGEARQNASAMMAGQGLYGTGGIPAQLMTEIGNTSNQATMTLESDLMNQQFNLLKYLQDYELQVAGMNYNSDWAKYNSRADMFNSTANLSGSAFLAKYLGAI